MALFSAQFKREPIPWMYSFVGAMFFTAFLKLHPFHRAMRKLEIRNISDYFSGRFVPKRYRKTLHYFQAALICYFSSIKRVLSLSSKARQDYFALNRVGCFVAEEIPRLEANRKGVNGSSPLLIVPGLNTPPVFFKEMHQYFTEKGFAVSVLTLPEKGLSDISTASKALADEITRLKDVCQTENINVVGHCLGGLIGQHYLSHLTANEISPIKNLITLGTGFMGADGVKNLRDKWADGHPTQAIPKVFDELINWNMDIAVKAGEVAYHNFITVFDFIIYFQKGLLNMDGLAEMTDSVKNYIIDDADIDHITLALNHKIFRKIELALATT